MPGGRRPQAEVAAEEGQHVGQDGAPVAVVVAAGLEAALDGARAVRHGSHEPWRQGRPRCRSRSAWAAPRAGAGARTRRGPRSRPGRRRRLPCSGRSFPDRRTHGRDGPDAGQPALGGEQEGTEAAHREAEEADPAEVVAPAAEERHKFLHQHRLGVAAVGAGVPPGVPAVHGRDGKRRAAGVEVPLQGLVGGQALQQDGVAAAESVQEHRHGQFGLRAAGRHFGRGQGPVGGDPAAGRRRRTSRRWSGRSTGPRGRRYGSGGRGRLDGGEALRAGCERGGAKPDSCQLKQPAPGQGGLVHSPIIGSAAGRVSPDGSALTVEWTADGLTRRPRVTQVARGTSGLRRAGWWVTPTRGNPQASATENRPPACGACLHGPQGR